MQQQYQLDIYLAVNILIDHAKKQGDAPVVLNKSLSLSHTHMHTHTHTHTHTHAYTH